MNPKSLCVFIHYSTYNFIPIYVKLYINELSQYYDEIIISTNKRKILREGNYNKKVRIIFTENNGYDFGRFYSIFKQLNKLDYYRISFINDSNILIKSLNGIYLWADMSDLDFWGLIESFEKPKNYLGKESYHIQSHFLTFEKRAISLLTNFFENIDFETLIKNKDNLSSLRDTIIYQCEIGLSQYFIEKNLRIKSFIKTGILVQKYNIEHFRTINPSLLWFDKLLIEDYPLIKRNIIKNELKFLQRLNPAVPFNNWTKLCLKYTDNIYKTLLIILENKLFLIYQKTNFRIYKVMLTFLNSLITIKYVLKTSKRVQDA